MVKDNLRIDHKVIFRIIEPGASVMDLGCGTGDLLTLLVEGKGVKAYGIELKEEAIYNCVERGLSVFHGDLESGLGGYPDKAFDYVIMNQSLQEVRNIDFIVGEALRVGRKVIAGFPNFAHFKARFDLFFRGGSPMSAALPYRWYDTPNVHFFSIADFRSFCAEKGIVILQEHFLGEKHLVPFLPNVFAQNAIVVITNP
ncbi:MAG: methionine biosynthesis protein MetW [Elusimicrobia bacterium]|nr:methionine biosynthesis protein MetW [Elusimicrobiota bacterium]